ncbi:Aldo/keto reductase [Laetiporus sulphureus 93-53]|uniref:Aldo/keto reductase n=1 Tax=Laetiporus sulphureus 93-53 TaxID=1314785 RepID=A0A165IHP9_9APHY|nr:Aldo/keto reductase [Laetiporus sulphureus 93-53]KZT13088.1 Aldo/keto reductase [Laetiporus sulphureus 93-53]
MSLVPKLKLNTGALIPAIGLGGWSGTTKEQHAQATPWMLTALQSGYRHIDTAWGYGTEKCVGEAIRKSGVPREEIWITTKLPWNHPGLRTVEESLDDSLKNLGTSYVDLYLLHWPQVVDWPDEGPDYSGPDKIREDAPTFNETWAAMEEMYHKGKAKNIGVSNFSVKTLEELLKTAKVVPAVNQVEMHPYLAQPDLKAYCDAKGILLTAYTPTGYGTVRSDPTIVELAQKYKVSPAQIILAWHVARGVVAVPKSSNVERQKENINLPTLEEEDFKRVTALDRGERLCNKVDENGYICGWPREKMGW